MSARSAAERLREKAKELLEIADELDALTGAPAKDKQRPTVKPTRRGYENLERAYRRNGVYPTGDWKK